MHSYKVHHILGLVHKLFMYLPYALVRANFLGTSYRTYPYIFGPCNSLPSSRHLRVWDYVLQKIIEGMLLQGLGRGVSFWGNIYRKNKERSYMNFYN